MSKKKKPKKPWPPNPTDRAPSNPYALEGRQWLFCQEYILDENGTQAAIRAGYAAKGAKQVASRLLTNANVQRAIADLREKRNQRFAVEADRILQELAALALSDIGEVMDFSGNDVKLRPASAIPEKARRAIAAMKVKRYLEGGGENAREVEVTEFKFWDKLQALVKLGQELGMFKKQTETTGPGGGPVQIEIVGIDIADQDDPGEIP